MSHLLVHLDRILPNPFQTRTDYGDVAQLAERIADALEAFRPTRGLMQIPAARLTLNAAEVVDDAYLHPERFLEDHPDARVELAYGHRRWQAFDLLADRPAWADRRMPLVIARLTDEEMLDAVWAENRDRKETNPIEDALLMAAAIERMQLTQKDLGQRWKLARSSVANKLRLLELPDEARDALITGEISERQALALKTVYDWPAELQEVVDASNRLAQAREGTPAETLRSDANSLLDERTLLIENLGHNAVALEGEGIRAATCAACPHTLNGKRCWSSACSAARFALWKAQQLADAVAATGVEAVDPDQEHWGIKQFRREGWESETGARALEERCEHLRLTTEPTYYGSPPRVPGFEHVRPVCLRGMPCECINAARRALPVNQISDEERAELRRTTARKEVWGTVIAAIESALAAQLEARIDRQLLTAINAASPYRTFTDIDDAAGYLARQICNLAERHSDCWDQVRAGELAAAYDLLLQHLLGAGFDEAARWPVPPLVDPVRVSA